MSKIINLAEDVASSLWSDWLTIVDMAHLDSALCCKALRKDFFHRAVLRYPVNLMNIKDNFDLDGMNSWIFSRNASVEGFFASAVFCKGHRRREEYLNQYGHAVRWIEYRSNSYGTRVSLHANRFSAVHVAMRCNQLTRFRDDGSLDPDVVAHVAELCPQLQHLTLRVGACTNESITRIARACRGLKRLKLRTTGFKVGEEALIALVHGNPGLLEVDISSLGVTNRFLQELALGCRSLVKLHLSNCGGITLTPIFSLLRHCKALVLVDIAHCDVWFVEVALDATLRACLRNLSFYEVRVEGRTVNALLRLCPNLVSLSIDNCAQELGQESLLFHANSGLRELSVMHSLSYISNATMLSISEHCPSLRVLKVIGKGGVSDLSDLGLCAVAARCISLQIVNLAYLVRVTDAFLLSLAQHARALQSLAIGGCHYITVVGMVSVLRGCPELWRISMSSTLMCTEFSEQKIKEQYPGVKNVCIMSDDGLDSEDEL
jgi:hypothetical protein